MPWRRWRPEPWDPPAVSSGVCALHPLHGVGPGSRSLGREDICLHATPLRFRDPSGPEAWDQEPPSNKEGRAGGPSLPRLRRESSRKVQSRSLRAFSPDLPHAVFVGLLMGDLGMAPPTAAKAQLIAGPTGRRTLSLQA